MVDTLSWLSSNWQIALVLGLLICSLGVYVSQLVELELVAITATLILYFAGVLSSTEVLAGFTNKATITVAAMFVLSSAVYNTGSLNFLADLLSREGRKGYRRLLIVTVVVAGGLSAFINNTAIVAIFIPLLVGITVETKHPASRLLIPLSYASIFGGLCTMIGTSTNILVDSLATSQGNIDLSLFDFAPVGIVLLVVGVLYLTFIAPKLLPEREGPKDQAAHTGSTTYVCPLRISNDSPLCGQTIRNSRLTTTYHAGVMRLERDGERMDNPDLDTVLQSGDVLSVRVSQRKLTRMLEELDMTLGEDKPTRQERARPEILAEVVIAPNSALSDTSLTSEELRQSLGTRAIALRDRFGTGDDANVEFNLRPGDIVLIAGSREQLKKIDDDRRVVLVSEYELPTYEWFHSGLSIAVVIGVLTLAALDIVPVHLSALAGVVLLVLSGCMKMTEVYEAVDWKVIFLLAGLLPFGMSLQKSGASDLLASGLTSTLAEFGPVAVLAAAYLLTALMTELISNNGTVVIMVPIVLSVASSMGVDPKPFLFAVAYAGSASFLSPIGYQTNTMVMRPGNYRFTDYTKVGLPLMLTFWALVTLLVPLIWPF